MALPITGGMAGMLAAANEGQFAVDPDAGEALGTSIAQMRTELSAVLMAAQDLTQHARLGDLPEALHIADRNVLVADGDDASAIAVLRQFDAALEQAEQAVIRGMANYAEVEAQARQRVGGAG